MQSLKHVALRALGVVRGIAATWVICCFVMMTVSVWVQVGGRYVFNYSIAWSGELATIAQIWMVLVGAGLAARRNMHARVDILLGLFPDPARKALMLATLGLGLWFLAAIVQGAIPLIRLGQFQTTPALGVPVLIPYFGLIIGPIYFAVELCAATAASWAGNSDADGDSAADSSI